MKALLILSFNAVLSIIGVIHAQGTNDSISPFDWGFPSCGAQLSVICTNKTLTIGQEKTFIGRITNSANLPFYVILEHPESDYTISISNQTTGVTVISPPVSNLPDSPIPRLVKPATVYRGLIPIHINEKVKPGHYILSATRTIVIPRDGNNAATEPCKLISNESEVDIVNKKD